MTAQPDARVEEQTGATFKRVFSEKRAAGHAAYVSGVIPTTLRYPSREELFAGLLPIKFIPPSPFDGQPKLMVIIDDLLLATKTGALSFRWRPTNMALGALNALLARRGEGLVSFQRLVDQHGLVSEYKRPERRGDPGHRAETLGMACHRLRQKLGEVGIDMLIERQGIMLEPGLVIVDLRTGDATENSGLGS